MHFGHGKILRIDPSLDDRARAALDKPLLRFGLSGSDAYLLDRTLTHWATVLADAAPQERAAAESVVKDGIAACEITPEILDAALALVDQNAELRRD